jgi:calcineurin-like phosphoesterase family protein
MAAERMSDKLLIETLQALDRNDANQAAAARELGIACTTFKSRVYAARDRGLHLSEGARNSMQSAGLNGVEAKGGWIHNYDAATGNKTGTTRWSAPVDGEAAQKSIFENIANAFDGIKSFAIPPPVCLDGHHMTVYPLYDMHIGMMAWGRETRGQDFDLKLMKSDLMQSITTVMARSPDSSEALIILGGDTIHVNDHFNETPASGHHQDADGRFEKIIDVAIEAISGAIELVAQKHATVKVLVLRGNHDETSHIVLKAALKQRYRDTDHIEFPVLPKWDKSEMFWELFGDVLIIAHHGDKAKPEKLAMIAADKCPDYSRAKYRVILTGHIHTLKVMDMPGVTHYSLRAFCPPDAYGANFGGVRGIQAMTFDKAKGLVVSAHDPINRE